MKRLAAIACLALAGCDALPRDPDGTLDRVTRSKQLVVGLAAPNSAPAAALVSTLARETGTRPVVRGGSLEPLIVDLDADRVDIVLAEVAKRTPWKTLVAPGPPLSARDEGRERVELRALMKNGENRWIMLVERASRGVAR